MNMDVVHQAEQRILDLQAQHAEMPLDPDELFDNLRSDFDETTLAKAMWRLIDAAKLELTSDRKLARIA